MVTRGRQVQLTIAVHISMVAPNGSCPVSDVDGRGCLVISEPHFFPNASLGLSGAFPAPEVSADLGLPGFRVRCQRLHKRSLRDYRVIAKVLLLREVGVSGSLLL